jgi:molecular chaperone GrpE
MEDKEIQQESTTQEDFGINADENAAGTTHLNNPVEEDSYVEKLTAELEEQKDKYLRLFAEFDNYRRRTAKESIELRQTAGKEVIAALLDVVDDCDRAEKQMETDTDIQHVKEGAILIFNKLRKKLQSRGLRKWKVWVKNLILKNMKQSPRSLFPTKNRRVRWLMRLKKDTI